MNARMHAVLPDGSFTIDGFTTDITERKTAEKALQDREERLRTTLNSVGDGVIATDFEGRIRRMNPVERAIQSGTIVGLANHTVLISRQAERYHIADSEGLLREVFDSIQDVKTLSSGKTNHETVSFQSPDGDEWYGDVHAYPRTAADGTIRGAVEHIRDTTAQKRNESLLAEERARLANIIEAADVGTWEWNARTGETRFNERWATVFSSFTERSVQVVSQIPDLEVGTKRAVSLGLLTNEIARPAAHRGVGFPTDRDHGARARSKTMLHHSVSGIRGVGVVMLMHRPWSRCTAPWPCFATGRQPPFYGVDGYAIATPLGRR